MRWTSTGSTMSIVTSVFVILTHFSSLASSQDQSIPGNPSCQLRATCDKSNTSVIDCVFPVNISFFHVSIYKEPENSPAIIITCSPCRIAEEFDSLIILKFPETSTQGETWTFEVKRSPNTLGSYTCYGFQGPTSLRTTQCNITNTSGQCSLSLTEEESNTPDSSTEMLPLISIPVVILVLILVLVVVYRRKLFKDKRQSPKVPGDQNRLPSSIESSPLKIQGSEEDPRSEGDGLVKTKPLSPIELDDSNGGTKC